MELLSPFAVLIYVVCGVIGLLIGRTRGRPLAGFLLGFFLSAIGWIITAFLRPSREVLMTRETERQEIAAEVERRRAQGV